MKKKNLLFIVIFSTVVSIFNMMYYSIYSYKSKNHEVVKLGKQEVVEYNKTNIPEVTTTNDSQGDVVKKVDEETCDTKDYVDVDDDLGDEQKNEDKISSVTSNENMEENNGRKDIQSDMYMSYMIKRGDSLENYKYYTKEEEQSVFKVSTDKIEENLTTADKIKLLYISFKLGKENYKKVEEYLYADDAEEGVLDALMLLKEDLSKVEYEKVRKIAEKFIDMDAAERVK